MLGEVERGEAPLLHRPAQVGRGHVPVGEEGGDPEAHGGQAPRPGSGSAGRGRPRVGGGVGEEGGEGRLLPGPGGHDPRPPSAAAISRLISRVARWGKAAMRRASASVSSSTVPAGDRPARRSRRPPPDRRRSTRRPAGPATPAATPSGRGSRRLLPPRGAHPSRRTGPSGGRSRRCSTRSTWARSVNPRPIPTPLTAASRGTGQVWSASRRAGKPLAAVGVGGAGGQGGHLVEVLAGGERAPPAGQHHGPDRVIARPPPGAPRPPPGTWPGRRRCGPPGRAKAISRTPSASSTSTRCSLTGRTGGRPRTDGGHGCHGRTTWPPSTLNTCPVIHDASSDRRKRHMPTRSEASALPLEGQRRRGSACRNKSGTTVRRRLGVDRPRGDGVGPDVVAAQLVGQLLGDGVHTGLGQAVEAGVEVGGGRGLVDDGPAAPGLHGRVAGPHAVEGAEHVHRQEPGQVVPVHGEQQVELHAAEDGGVVDQVVDAAEVLDGRLGHGHRRARVGHVDPDRPAVPPACRIPAATALAFSSSMSATSTAAPASARASAYAWPMPPAEPVTIATLPVKSNRTVGRPAPRDPPVGHGFGVSGLMLPRLVAAAAGDDPLGHLVHAGRQRPAHVVGEVEHRLPHLFDGQLAPLESGLELDLEQRRLPEGGEHPDGHQPAVPDAEVRPGPDVAEEVVDGVVDVGALDCVGVDGEPVDLLHLGHALGPGRSGPVLLVAHARPLPEWWWCVTGRPWRGGRSARRLGDGLGLQVLLEPGHARTRVRCPDCLYPPNGTSG